MTLFNTTHHSSQEPFIFDAAMTNDSLSSAFTINPPLNNSHNDEHDSVEEEITFLNPFATQQLPSTVRHRAAPSGSGQARREYSSTFMHEHVHTFGDSSSSAMPLSHQPKPLHLQATNNTTHITTSGVLELEEEDESSTRVQEEDLLGLNEQDTRTDSYPTAPPLCTDSGLLLTHRQAPSNSINNMPRVRPTYRHLDNQNNPNYVRNTPGTTVHENGHALEVDSGHVYAGTHNHHHYSTTSPAIQQAKRFLSYVRLWNAGFVVILIIGTGVILHSIRQEHSNTSIKSDLLESVDSNTELYMQQQQQQ